nr:knob-associated histidine-rich protein-like [Nomia melanderi]
MDQQQPMQQQQQYRSHRYNYHHHHHHYHHANHHHHYHHRHHRRHHRSPSLENDEDEDNDQNHSGAEDSYTSPIRPEPRYRIPIRGSLDNAPIDPHLLCCQIWRWPDLTHSSELKRLPVCHSAKDPVYICCNPYHWGRLCKPESPPPPYCLIADRLRPEGFRVSLFPWST